MTKNRPTPAAVASVYEVDKTSLDCLIVASSGPRRVIRRPTCTYVVDRRTRSLVGFHIDMLTEPPLDSKERGPN